MGKIASLIKRFLQVDLQKKGYMSEIDQFLVKFNENNPDLSESQKRELHKFNRIKKLRDKPHKVPAKSQIWTEF